MCSAVTALAFENLVTPTVLEARKRILASPNGGTGTAARLGRVSPLEAQHP